MNPLLTITASDGSSLVLGEEPADQRQPFALVFQHEGHGSPTTLFGLWAVLPVRIAGSSYVVCAGDIDEPDLDRVLLEFPHDAQTCPVRFFPRHPRAWMSFPARYEPNMQIRASFLGGDRVLIEDASPPLQPGVAWLSGGVSSGGSVTPGRGPDGTRGTSYGPLPDDPRST
jgi:hypothetical protein